MSWTSTPKIEPEEVKEPKPKHRARRSRYAKPALGLLNALKFIKPVRKKSGSVIQQHCFIAGNFLAATDGILTMATPIQEDLYACPQTYQLEEALKQVGEDLSITQDGEALSVVSGDFTAVISTITPEELVLTPPDPQIAVIDNRLLDALDVLEPIPIDGAETAWMSSILIKSGLAVACDRRSLVEYWHGIDLPEILIPKQAAKAILRTKKELTGFGFSETSATFYFEDGSFLKTLLYESRLYPDNYRSVFDKFDCETWELPDEFFKAVKIISEFSSKGRLYFEEGKIMSKETSEEASSYVIPDLPDGMVFDSQYLLKVKKACKQVHFIKNYYMMYFYGDNCRGAVRSVVKDED